MSDKRTGYISWDEFFMGAAMLCAEDAKDIRSIDIKGLQQKLMQDDCYLPDLRNEDAVDYARNACITPKSPPPSKRSSAPSAKRCNAPSALTLRFRSPNRIRSRAAKEN